MCQCNYTKRYYLRKRNPSKDSWGALQNKNSDTLTGMEEEGLLYNSSQKMKYYAWLGLAIIALVIVIRKLKS